MSGNRENFVFREISSIVYNFSFCCVSCGCVAGRQLGFFCCFSSNRHIWKIVRLSCKFRKLGFFCISPRIGEFGNSRDYFANFYNLQICQDWIFLYLYWHISRRLSSICKFPKFATISKIFFFREIFYSDFDEICAKITL